VSERPIASGGHGANPHLEILDKYGVVEQQAGLGDGFDERAEEAREFGFEGRCAFALRDERIFRDVILQPISDGLATVDATLTAWYSSCMSPSLVAQLSGSSMSWMSTFESHPAHFRTRLMMSATDSDSCS
jgi:hypothetical protein